MNKNFKITFSLACMLALGSQVAHAAAEQPAQPIHATLKELSTADQIKRPAAWKENKATQKALAQAREEEKSWREAVLSVQQKCGLSDSWKKSAEKKYWVLTKLVAPLLLIPLSFHVLLSCLDTNNKDAYVCGLSAILGFPIISKFHRESDWYLIKKEQKKLAQEKAEIAAKFETLRGKSHKARYYYCDVPFINDAIDTEKIVSAEKLDALLNNDSWKKCDCGDYLMLRYDEGDIESTYTFDIPTVCAPEQK